MHAPSILIKKGTVQRMHRKESLMTQMQLSFRELQEKERANRASESLKAGELAFKEKELKWAKDRWMYDTSINAAQHWSDNFNKITTTIISGLL